MATTCTAPDCTRPARARGYCDTHYRRVRKWGDPTVVLRPWGTGHYVPGQITDWQRGFLTARREVRQLLDGTDE